MLRPHLPFEARFLVAGTTWRISTNAHQILAAAREMFPIAGEEADHTALTGEFYVDSSLGGKPPWPPPYFRGLDHLVYASYDSHNSMLVDLRGRRVIGLFSSAMAADRHYWKRVLLPVLLGIVSASIGVTPLHCACLVKNGFGLVVSGASGAGKSTLALSLCLKGFSYLSDEWTYFSLVGSRIQAWGLPTAIKLLPDSATYFPALRDLDPSISLNGELAFDVDPVETFGASRSMRCEPRWLVFVERTTEGRALFRRMTPEETASRFASELEALPACVSETRERQLETIRALVNRECWLLRHGLGPDSIARELATFCEVRGPE